MRIIKANKKGYKNYFEFQFKSVYYFIPKCIYNFLIKTKKISPISVGLIYNTINVYI